MSLHGENNILWEQVVKSWYVHGMRITGCGFMHVGLHFQCIAVSFYGMWMM